jgi:hypothetical protein
LCASRDEARVAASMLKPAFGNLVELADPCAFTIDEGILARPRGLNSHQFSSGIRVKRSCPTPRSLPTFSM